MRLVLQRVTRAKVVIAGDVVGEIGAGFAILVGIGKSDTPDIVDRMVDKVARLRVFEDDHGKMNLSAEDVRAEFLVVSQFTLYADTSGGRRPSFINAAPPDLAAPLVDRFADRLRARGFQIATGRFGAFMDVELVNSGPVTIILTSDE
jgi:D-tyrosyl-tRNA(Tyr) deacylase